MPVGRWAASARRSQAAARTSSSAKRVSNQDETDTYGITARRTDDVADRTVVGAIDNFKLTASESQVLRLLVNGLTAQEVATKLRNSVEMVRTHVRRVYTKLEVGSREALFTRLRPFLIDD